MEIQHEHQARPEDSEPPSVADYSQHERTYAGFTHLLRWVCAHLLLMLIGLYFLVIQNNPAAGTFFILIAIAAIVYGIVTIPSTEDKIAEHPERWHGAGKNMISGH